MLRKFALLFGGIVLALTLALPATAAPAKKSPAQTACMQALKQAHKTFHAQQKAAKKTFHDTQKAANKTHHEQQKAAKEACKAL